MLRSTGTWMVSTHVAELGKLCTAWASCFRMLNCIDFIHLESLSGCRGMKAWGSDGIWVLGSKRCTNLFNAARSGAASAPVDLRFLKKPRVHTVLDFQSVRADCISYLSSIYESVAEVIPDVRDDQPLGVGPGEGVQTGQAILDAYEIELHKNMDAGPADLPAKANPPPKKKKVHTKRRGVEMNPDRLSSLEECKSHEVRFLPPSSMKQFWEQYKLVSNLERPASFPTFWKVIWKHFFGKKSVQFIIRF